MMDNMSTPTDQRDDDRSHGAADAAAQAWEEARERWPQVRLPWDRFWLRFEQAERLSGETPHFGTDLFLTEACLAGDTHAIAEFEARHLAPAKVHLNRYPLTEDGKNEILQKVRIRLLTGDTPRLATFTGAGPLDMWLRVVVTREALGALAPRAHAEIEFDEMRSLLVGGSGSAEEAVMAQVLSGQHREPMRQALSEALAQLSSRDKTVLRMYILDEVSVETMAKIFGVHRATVARWLASIRKDVLAMVNRRLSLRLGASPTEVRSLFRAFEQDIHLSMKRLLGEAGEA